MRNFEPAKFDRRLEERMAIIVVLGRRCDHILYSPDLDLKALEQLIEDYESAKMPCAAAALRKRLEWHQGETRKIKMRRGSTYEIIRSQIHLED